MSGAGDDIDGIAREMCSRLRFLAAQRDVVAVADALDSIGATLAACMEAIFPEAELVRLARATDHRSAHRD